MLKYGSWELMSEYTPAKGIRHKGRVVLINRYELYRPQEMQDMNHGKDVLHPRPTGSRLMYVVYGLPLQR